MKRLAFLLTLIGTANIAFAQADNPMIGDWQCSIRETARDATRTVGVFRGTATLRIHANQTVSGEAIPDGERPRQELAARWTGSQKQIVLQLANGAMRGSLVRAKLLLWSSAN